MQCNSMLSEVRGVVALKLVLTGGGRTCFPIRFECNDVQCFSSLTEQACCMRGTLLLVCRHAYDAVLDTYEEQ